MDKTMSSLTTVNNNFEFIHQDTTAEAFDRDCSTLSKDQYTRALIKAATVGNGVLIEHIVQNKGHDVNSSDERGNTALGAAIYRQDYALAKQLIRLGADVNRPCAAPEI